MNPTVGGRKVEQVQKYTPEQMKLFNQSMNNVDENSFLYKLASGDPELMNEMNASAMRDFSGVQGNLASRFSGMGGRKSSGFKNAASAEGRTFAENISAQRNKLRMDATRELQEMSNQLLGQRPYEQFMVEPQDEQNPWQKALLGGLPGVVGAGIGGYFGGVPGATAGYQVGNSFGNAFMG